MTDGCYAAAEIVRDSDAVVIVASNGLSISEGLRLFARDGTFADMFPELAERHGVHSIIETVFCPTLSAGEEWGFWTRLIGRYSMDYRTSETMRMLRDLVEGRDVFIVTTNGEGHFTSAGFGEGQVFEVEGNWRTMQCSERCHDGIYPSLDTVRHLRWMESDCRIPEKEIPRCPRCGAAMRIRMQRDRAFVPDSEASARFEAFLERNRGRRLAVLELGVGSRNTIIKRPMMQLVASAPNIRYITVNKGDLYIPLEIQGRSVGIDDLIDRALEGILRCLGDGE